MKVTRTGVIMEQFRGVFAEGRVLPAGKGPVERSFAPGSRGSSPHRRAVLQVRQARQHFPARLRRGIRLAGTVGPRKTAQNDLAPELNPRMPEPAGRAAPRYSMRLPGLTSACSPRSWRLGTSPPAPAREPDPPVTARHHLRLATVTYPASSYSVGCATVPSVSDSTTSSNRSRYGANRNRRLRLPPVTSARIWLS